jgi:hypothetical protein
VSELTEARDGFADLLNAIDTGHAMTSGWVRDVATRWNRAETDAAYTAGVQAGRERVLALLADEATVGRIMFDFPIAALTNRAEATRAALAALRTLVPPEAES